MINPETTQEWAKYITDLSAEELFDQAETAGTTTFADLLREEGKNPQQIHGVLVLFAQEFQKRGLEPPGRANGCYVDFRRILTIE